MTTINRLLDTGEPLQASDEYFTLQFGWKKRSDWKEGDVLTAAHHPTRRKDVVLYPEEATKAQRIEEYTKAALTGLCAQQRVIEDAMKKTPGGSQQDIRAVIGGLAVGFGKAAAAAYEAEGVA